jgi:hypothetical protein
MRDLIIDIVLFVLFIAFGVGVSVWYENMRNAKPVENLGKTPYIITPEGAVTYEEFVQE